ncbi:MAG: restriction endonuclease subunit S [Gallionella sp.]|nr:restriction endonuclease subunit S [Gallionella sp.]
MKIASYPSYRPSHIGWIRDIPKHWELKRLKYIANRSEAKVDADEDNPLQYIGLENVESWTGRLLHLDEDLVPTGIANRFESGDTLFGKLRPYLAKACNVDFQGLCSSELLVLRGNTYDRNFLLYQLLSHGFINLVNSSTYGSKMPRASWDFIGVCELPLPPIEEQQAIACFLDTQTARIDALLAKNHELINKLEEERSALIARTVTRGLPPDVAQAAGLEPHPVMKNSGVEWLNFVPAHWGVTRLGFLCAKIGSGKTPHGGADVYTDEGIMFLRSQNIYDEGFMLNDVVYITEEIDNEMQNTRVKPRDILLNVTGASLGRTCIVPTEFIYANVNQHVCIIRLADLNLSSFIAWVIKAPFIKAQIEAIQSGAAREGLNFDQISKFILALPPLVEQHAIATYLDRETAHIDQLTAKVETAIERLTEYRQALITSAVTGKINVLEIAQ